MLSNVKHYFDCHHFCAITHISDLLSNHVFDWQKELPSHPDDLKHLISDLTETMNHVMATVTLISELYTRLDEIDAFREDAATDKSSIFLNPQQPERNEKAINN